MSSSTPSHSVIVLIPDGPVQAPSSLTAALATLDLRASAHALPKGLEQSVFDEGSYASITASAKLARKMKAHKVLCDELLPVELDPDKACEKEAP